MALIFKPRPSDAGIYSQPLPLPVAAHGGHLCVCVCASTAREPPSGPGQSSSQETSEAAGGSCRHTGRKGIQSPPCPQVTAVRPCPLGWAGPESVSASDLISGCCCEQLCGRLARHQSQRW